MKGAFNWEGDHVIDNHSERHGTPSGRFLGIGCAMTYLWGEGFGAGAVLGEDEVVEESAGRTWNLANRLMTENFSNSWHSTLTSKIDAAALSSLYHQKECMKTWHNFYSFSFN